MNIILAGDSYGYPNYDKQSPLPTPEYHLQYLLQDAGHYVINASKNGCTNIKSLNRIHEFHNGKQYDYVIWFHTSPLRDYMYGQACARTFEKFDNDMYVAQDYYEKISAQIKNIVSEHNVKFIAIGGCTALSHHIDKENLYYYIDDWKSEIIGKKLPRAIWWGCMDYPVTPWYDVSEVETMISELTKSEDFPDNGHPGIRPHADLMQRLTEEVFKKTINSNY